MELIDKDKIKAEIDDMLNTKEHTSHCDEDSFNSGRWKALTKVKGFINTLEVVKEVDLEKEFDDYTKDIIACDVQFEPFTHLYNCAKYFYELGLKAKGE